MMSITRVFATIAAANFLLAAGLALAGTAAIQIDASKPGVRLNPQMYGIFLEEINHGVDGGLYAELIANRAFEDSRPPEGFTLQDGRYKDEKGYDAGFEVKPGVVPRWSLVREGGAEGEIKLQSSGGLNDNTPCCLQIEAREVASGRVGVANDGFWGIGVRQGDRYDLSFYARADTGDPGLRAVLEDPSGQPCSEVLRWEGVRSEYKQFKGTFNATRTEPKARLVLSIPKSGRVCLDFVSLLPARTWKNHGLRPDIAQMIADLKPGFVRFPGGCVVEGGTVQTAYNWKLTVGPVEQRPERWNAWSYRRTHGLGFHEYLQFCEDLGAAPMHVGFAGQTCLYRHVEHVPMPQMSWVITNFLDALEYANGKRDSRWGAKRASGGHPAPFDLQLVEIGNENGGSEYEDRYRLIYPLLKAKYPKVTYIADYLIRNASYDLVDDHFYNSPQWFVSQFRHYDRRERSLAPVYVGEIAVTSGEGGDLKGNMLAALAEGVFLMGCERNADAVRMVSYAPLLAHVSGRSGWHGMIYHDSLRVFGTASYYLWKLFGVNRPDRMLPATLEITAAEKPLIKGGIGVGTWDTSAEFKDIRVEQGGRTLYASDFSQPGSDSAWRKDGGQWSLVDGAWRQSQPAVGLSYVGEENWSDYTLTLKARKLAGAEGFLVVFGRKGGDKYWWNLGGWGNREHGVEYNRQQVGRRVPGQIETGRWYDIKVELRGQTIRCFLDGKLVHEEQAADTGKIFAVAGKDEARGEMVLKVINTSEEPFATSLNITGTQPGNTAVVTVLKGEPRDNNSLAQPTRIAPATSTLQVLDKSFNYEFPPCSLTIMRLKLP